MVAALPEEAKRRVVASVALTYLKKEWENKTGKEFDPCPFRYGWDLRRAGRRGCIRVVKLVLKERCQDLQP